MDTHFVVECRHCGNKGLMEILAEKQLLQNYVDDPNSRFPLEWEAGYIYQILRCYACSDVTVHQLSIHSEMDPEDLDQFDKVLYPCEGEPISGLPTKIQSEWDAAIRVRRINQNAFAVLLGRVLDAICTDQNGDGKDLYQRIENLAKLTKLPQPLKQVAHELRRLRNFGAHGNLGDLDSKDAPLLESLCRALILYLYTVPALTRNAQKRLNETG